jgi:hypothetical protein
MQDDHADEQHRKGQAPVTRIFRLDASAAKRLIRKAIEQPIDLFGHIEGLVDWLYTNLVDHQIDEFTDLWAKKIEVAISRDERGIMELADSLPESCKVELAREWLSDSDIKALAVEWLDLADSLPESYKVELAREWLSDSDIKALAVEWLDDDDVACLADALNASTKAELVRKWIDRAPKFKRCT